MSSNTHSLSATLAKQVNSTTLKGSSTAAYDSAPDTFQQLDKKVFTVTSYSNGVFISVVNWLNEHKLKYRLTNIQDTNNIIITFKNKADASFFKLSMEDGDDE